MGRNYIVITPCRNEESNLPNLIAAITNQTIRPKLWVIVDDNSTDNSAKIIKEAEKSFKWIKGIYLKEKAEYMGSHLAFVCNCGFEFAINFCKNHRIPYDYIALVDADNIPEPAYFEKLIKEFEKDPKLGISSGHTFRTISLQDYENKKINIDILNPKTWEGEAPNPKRDDLPMGSARIWRRECFEETGGYILTHAPDSVSNVKAKMKGWKTKRFTHAKVIEREALLKRSLIKGYIYRGKKDFHLWYPFSVVFLKSLKYSFRFPFYYGVLYLYGYLKSYSREKDARTNDPDLKYYNTKIRLKELLKIKIGERDNNVYKKK